MIEKLVVVHPNRNGREIEGLVDLIRKYSGIVIIIQHPDDPIYEIEEVHLRRIESKDCLSFTQSGDSGFREFLKTSDLIRVVGCYLSEIDNTPLCVDRVLEFCQKIVSQAYADTKYCITLRPK